MCSIINLIFNFLNLSYNDNKSKGQGIFLLDGNDSYC